MKCTRVGARIEITLDLNPLTYKNTVQFVKSLDDVKWHGFNNPPKHVWTVLDTPEVRQQLIGRGYPISEGVRECTTMLAALENMCKLADQI